MKLCVWMFCRLWLFPPNIFLLYRILQHLPSHVTILTSLYSKCFHKTNPLYWLLSYQQRDCDRGLILDTDPLRLCNFNPSNTSPLNCYGIFGLKIKLLLLVISCRHDRRSTTTQQPLEQYVLWRKWGDFRWCYLTNIRVVKTKFCDLWKPN